MNATPNIDKALFAAHGQMISIGRDGHNVEDGYTFTSSDKMIVECRAVLLSNGLVVRRRDFAVAADGSKTESTFVVAHPASGEREIAIVEFPVHYEDGKPADKSVAASLTTVFGYWLRDLLALPRLDGNEMGSRAKGTPAASQQPTTGGTASPRRASPVRPEDEKFDPNNRRHVEAAALAFDEKDVRSDGLRAMITEKFLIGRRLGDIGQIIPREVQAYWDSKDAPKPSRRGWRR